MVGNEASARMAETAFQGQRPRIDREAYIAGKSARVVAILTLARRE